jgi:hypothetical protein
MAAATLNSPGKILKLWNKAVKKHEEGKKPQDLPKKGQDQKLRIKKGLTSLKAQAAADMSSPAHRQAFLGLRDKVAKVMRQYCRYLKTSKDEDKKVLPRYLKTAKQLTIVVQDLSPDGLDLSEEELGLEALEAVNDTALDGQLAQTEADADSVDLEAEETAPAEQEEAPPVDDKAAQWTERRKALEPQLIQALKENRGDTSKIRAIFAFAQEKAQAGDYGKALQGLDQLAVLLRQAGDGKSAAANGLAAWQAARKQVIGQIRQVEAAVARTKDPGAGPVVMVFESIIKNLSAEPTTPQNIAELERYLQDEVITAAEEVPSDLGSLTIRTPLLQALAALKQ